MTPWMQRAKGSGLPVWLALFATLILIALILAAIIGMGQGLLIFMVVGAVVMGLWGIFVLLKLLR